MEKEEKQRKLNSGSFVPRICMFLLIIFIIFLLFNRSGYEINFHKKKQLNSNSNNDQNVIEYINTSNQDIIISSTTATAASISTTNKNDEIVLTKKNITPESDIMTIAYLPPKQPKSLGMNILDGKSYEHHPVLLQIPIIPYYFDPDSYMVEVNGLKVPIEFDCNNLNENRVWNKKYNNFFTIPSRWHHCYIHEGIIKAGMDQEIPQLPIIDEEYSIFVSVIQSTLRAKENFNMIEVGAKWGTWSGRAIKSLNSININMNYRLFFLEPDLKNCEAIEIIMKLNSIKYELNCESSNIKTYTQKFIDWSNTQKHIDLVSFDLRGDEDYLIPDLKDNLDLKVYRIIVKTQNQDIHNQLKNFFKDWIIIFDMPCLKTSCYEKLQLYLQGLNDENNEERFQWWKIIDEGCFMQTTWGGKIANWNGILVLDNPKFVNKEKVFSLTDTVLKVDDLKI